MRRRARVLLALATGLLVWLAFPTVGLWPLGFVAWLPLFHALQGTTPAEATSLGWISGTTMHLLGAAFLLRTLERSGALGTPTAIAALVAFATYQGLRTGAVAFLMAKAATRSWPLDIAFVLAFFGSEVAFPLILPWTFGATVHRIAPLLQVADVGGAPLVSVVLVATNLGIYALLLGRRSGIAWLALPTAALAYGVIRILTLEDRMADAPSLDVGVVQAATAPGSRDAPTAFLIEASRGLARRGARLVVHSEAVLPGVFPEDDLDGPLAAIVSGDLGVPTILGLTVRRVTWDEHQEFFNTAIFLDERGHIAARHDKHNLLPFGEYLPFAFLRELSPRSGGYSVGKIEPRYTTERVRPSLSICYEDVHPDLVGALARRERPNILVNVTNDGWFAGSAEPRIHIELARARAVEQGMYLVRATNDGVSAVIDPAGRTVAELPSAQRGVLLWRVRLLDEGTVYRRVGDGPAWGALGAVVALGFVRRPKPKPSVAAVSPSTPS